MNVRLGTRSSKLAVWQTMFVAERLRRRALTVEVRVVHISTHGDENQDRPLPEIGGKGLFTEKIEESLRQNEIDAAVHSLKDLPVDDSAGPHGGRGAGQGGSAGRRCLPRRRARCPRCRAGAVVGHEQHASGGPASGHEARPGR